jgi:hypothetical protein
MRQARIKTLVRVVCWDVLIVMSYSVIFYELICVRMVFEFEQSRLFPNCFDKPISADFDVNGLIFNQTTGFTDWLLGGKVGIFMFSPPAGART